MADESESRLIKTCEIGQRQSVLNLLRQLSHQAYRERKPVLLKAIEGRHSEIVNIFLQNGANPNVCDSLGESALHVALRTHQTDVAAAILQYGPNVNEPNHQGLVPIHQAVHQSDMDLVNKLILMGADINMVNPNGQTPLMIACKNGCIQLCLNLLQNGADLYAKDNNGWSALDYAILAGLMRRIQTPDSSDDKIVPKIGSSCKVCNQRLPIVSISEYELSEYHNDDTSINSVTKSVHGHDPNCAVRSDRTSTPPFDRFIEQNKENIKPANVPNINKSFIQRPSAVKISDSRNKA